MNSFILPTAGKARRAVIAGKAFLLLALLLMVAVLGAGCGGDEAPQGGESQDQPATRTFEMGLSSLPQEPSEAGYEEVFSLAGQNGELILIQRAPPWAEFLPGGSISTATLDMTREEKRLAEENSLRVFAAVDPLDPADRGRLASLPEDLGNAGFADSRVRTAFIAYAQYLALNLKPRYMALGTEVDLYEAARPDDFDNFVSLYFEAYDAVKDVSPETLVFATFQMEAVQNLFSESGPASQTRPPTRWYLVQRFQPKLDVLAVTTYPSFAFASPEDIPAGYYDQLHQFGDVPVAVAAAGYSSGQGRDGVNEGTEEKQAAFLKRLFQDAQRLNMAFVVWFACTDPSVVQEEPLDLLQYIGLHRADGSAKPAWQAWAQEADIPYSPAARQ